jgi:predicted Zn-dependent protease
MDIVPCALCGTEYDGRRRFCPRCGEPREAQPGAAPSSGDRASGSRRARVVGLVVTLAVTGIVAALAVPRRQPAAPVASVQLPAPQSQVPSPQALLSDDRPDPASIPPAERAFLGELAKGQIAFDAGRLDEALAEFARAFESDPKNGYAANSAGQTLVRLDRHADAIPYLEQAVALAPNRGDFRFNLARAFGQAGRWPEAVGAYREAAGLTPDHYPTAYNLAQALEKMGDAEAALAEYHRGSQLAPLEPSFRLAIGTLAERLGRWDESQRAYQEYLELVPDGGESAKVKQRVAQVSARHAPGAEGGSAPGSNPE